MEAPKRKRRLFVGIDLDETARAACAAVSAELRKTGFGAKYESPEKLHVTLAFLGFVEPASVAAIVSQLASSALRCAPSAVTLDKLGAFPHERRPRVVYIGAREQGASFRALAAGVRNGYAAHGFDFTNDPVAHVTVARVKESTRALPLLEFKPISLQIRRLVLFESLPDPAHETSRYEVLASAQLDE
jgi:RNA 2',3'-cyclic 3'-phosphodiesterase